MAKTSLFDDLTDIYEAMIDWPKRLGSEGPFLRRLFEQAGAKRIADVACGTGRHAAMFHGWGLQVQGSDISPNMLRRARATFGEPAGLSWIERGFEQPPGPAESFDAVVCLGNSLALAPDRPTVATALRAMLESTRPGGVVVVHVLNLWKIQPGPCVWQKVLPTSIDGRDVLVLKGIHRCQQEGRVELVVVPRGDESNFIANSAVFLGLEADELAAIAKPTASQIAFFGNTRSEPYDRTSSGDLIMVAQR